MKDLRQTLLQRVTPILHKLGRYRILFFFLLVVGVYGFLVYRIEALNNAKPTGSAVNTVTQVPRVDPTVLQQLQSLQDNSVNVQALFNQARSNPFQE